jgi:uncharacterized protein with beta-barrel porin domain
VEARKSIYHRAAKVARAAILAAITISRAWAEVSSSTPDSLDTGTFLDRIFPEISATDLNGVRVWDTAYAGHSSLAGDPVRNTQSVSASVVGTTFGADKQIDNVNLIGVSADISRQTFSSGSGNGSSNDMALTVYGRRTIFDRVNMAFAFGYGWHDVSTHRPFTVPSSLSLDADYHAHDLGGRLEAGYSLITESTESLVPFVAVVGDAYRQPGYSETASNGQSNLGLAYGPGTIDVSHTELGSRYFRYLAPRESWQLSLDANLAWERELSDNPIVLASFQTFPGSSFALHGTRPARDTRLLGLGISARKGGFTLSVRSDGRLGERTTILSGTANIIYQW